MEDSIVGLVVGAWIGLIIYVFNSKYYLKNQKIIIYISSIFLPLAIIVTLTFYFYNETKNLAGFKDDSYSNQLKDLNKLKNQGLFSEKELIEKESEIKSKVTSVKVDNYLKKTNEFKSLKKLLSQKAITQENYEEKLNILREKVSGYFRLASNQAKELKAQEIIGLWENTEIKVKFLGNGKFEYLIKKDKEVKKGTFNIKSNTITLNFHSLFGEYKHWKVVDINDNNAIYYEMELFKELDRIK